MTGCVNVMRWRIRFLLACRVWWKLVIIGCWIVTHCQHYDAGAPTVRQLQESHRWIDDRHFSEEQKYDASKTYFIHCHDIGHTEDIVQKFELQHVVLIGTFERWVRDGADGKDGIFKGFENLQSVKFLLPWVTHIGNDCCHRLENPSFIGLSSLLEVGTHWMDRCDALKNPSFTGLSSLLEVGSHWMDYCHALKNPSFTGLLRLEKIGSYWMAWCRALKSPSFTGLSSVTRVNIGPYGHKTVHQYFNIPDTLRLF